MTAPAAAIAALMSISLPVLPMATPPAYQQDVTHYYARKKGGKK